MVVHEVRSYDGDEKYTLNFDRKMTQLKNWM
jgi:hypothetical protein